MFICKAMIKKICTVFFILQDSLVSAGSDDGVRVVGHWDIRKKYPANYFEKKEIHVVDCCEIPHCPKGSHIVCESFNPTAQFGAKCHGAMEDIRMTSQYAQVILDNFNRARGEVAMGRAIGKRNVELPRAYGMMKLKWDSELATFAQLLANRCTVVYDHCRSTKRFKEPAQTTCEVHFQFEDWTPLINSYNATFEKGFSEAKILHAIEEAFLHDYKDKESVTINMIDNFPARKKPPGQTNGMRKGLYYLDLIHSNATHVGCGVSTYTNSATNSKNPKPVTVHTILLVCNLSHQPTLGGRAYDTDPPVRKTKKTKIGKSVCTSKAQCTAMYNDEELNPPFSECGCPEGTVEDENCLCEHSLEESNFNFESNNKKLLFHHRNEGNMKHNWDPQKAYQYNQDNGESYEKKEDCNTAVLLPIITEDGTNIQPEELASYFMSNTKSTEMNDGYIARTRHVRPRHRYGQRKNRVMDSHRRIPSQRYSYNNGLVPAERVPEIIENHENQHDWSSKRRTQVRNKNRISIFARARKFHLPLSKSITNISKIRTQDLTTRKDLLHTKQIVNPQRDESAMESKASLVTSFDNKDTHSNLSELSDIYQMFNSTNEPTQNNEYQMQNKTPADFVSPSKLNNRASNEKYSNEEPHKNSKLLHLINIIEKEVKKSKLNNTEKEKIHTKIKRILYSLHEDSNVPDDVKVLRDSTTMHNVKEDLKNGNDYMIEADAEYDVYKDQLPKRYHQSLLTKEPSYFMPIDERETKPFVLPVDFSEGEIAKDKESEEVISNDEYFHKKTQEPDIDYKTEIDDEKNKETEIIDTRYRKQNTNDNDEIYTKRFQDESNKYNEYEKDNIKSYHGYDYISNSDFADNDRFKNRYESNYTALDYGEDPLGEERREYYYKKLEEMRNKQLDSNQEDLQNQPALMQRRLRNLAVSRAQAARYYEPDQDRFIQGY